MEGNIQKMREALTKLVAYLDKEVRRTSTCKRCKFNGKSFRGEPCYWHVDCGIDQHDYEASDNAMYLLKKFNLQEALSAPPRNCDIGTAEEQAKRFGKLCGRYYNEEEPCKEECPLESLPIIHGFPRCQAYWAQMPYAEEGGEENGKA